MSRAATFSNPFRGWHSRWIVGVLALIAALITGAELLHRWAGRSAVFAQQGKTGVIVLGYPTRRNGRPHPIQRWRVRLGVRTMRALSAERLVFTGGAVANEFIEAETMAALATAAGVPAAAIALEREARSTWQNVAYTAPLVDDLDYVVITSDPLHARRARSYWIEQRPADAERVFVSDARRPFESTWSAVPTAAVEVVRSLRHRWRRIIARRRP